MRHPATRLAVAIVVAGVGMVLAANHAAPNPLAGTAPFQRGDVSVAVTPVNVAATRENPYGFSDSQLRGFVIAAVRIDRVILRTHRQTEETGAETAKEIVQRRTRRIIAATPGIDEATYRRIMDAVRTHEPTRARVRAVLADLRRAGRIEPRSLESGTQL